MMFSLHSFRATKRRARILLAVFLLSVINMSMQMPAHGAMQLQMQNQQMSAQMTKQMTHSMEMDMLMDNDTNSVSMMDCHCPPALCDSVLAVDNQTVDGLYPVEMGDERRFSHIIETLYQNRGQLNQLQRYTILQLIAEQSAPPPLLRKTLLLI